MDVYVLWPRCSWTWSSAVSMVEKIHHEDAIGNILYNTKSTNHWTKSRMQRCIHINFLHYYQIYYQIAYNYSPKEWSKMNIDMDREDNCLEDYEMYKIITVHHLIFRRSSGWLWFTQDITWWPTVNFPRDLTMPFLYMLLRWLPCFLIFTSKHIPKSQPKTVNDKDFRSFLVSVFYIYYEKEQNKKYMYKM